PAQLAVGEVPLLADLLLDRRQDLAVEEVQRVDGQEHAEREHQAGRCRSHAVAPPGNTGLFLAKVDGRPGEQDSGRRNLLPLVLREDEYSQRYSGPRQKSMRQAAGETLGSGATRRLGYRR